MSIAPPFRPTVPLQAAASASSSMPLRDAAAFALVVFGLLMIWTKAQPFTDLQDYATVDLAFRSSNTRKILTLLVAAGLGVLVLLKARAMRLVQLVDAPLIAVMVWFAYASLTSGVAGLALNRLVLAGVVIGIAACIPLLFDRLSAYLAALSTAALLVIGLSFAGALFAPDLAMHTVRDISEQSLAGNWRGIFGHKNDLAPMTVHFAFLGLLMIRLGRPFLGGTILVSSVALLILSAGKSALGLGPVCLVLGILIVRAPRTLSMLIAFGAIGALGTVTLGSLAFPPVQDFVREYLPDPTFTGRTEIWDYAMRAVAAEPWTGYGYAVFWDTGRITDFAEIGAYVTEAAHSHSGYLEIILSGGFPGLALVLVWAGFKPWTDVARIRARLRTTRDRAVLDYLTMSWLFTLLISALEAVLFNRGEPVWVMGLLSIAMLRYWARGRGESPA